jgi:hypothetical protein
VRLAFVLAAAVVGSALLAWQHPAPSNAYEAAGTLVVRTPGSTPAGVALTTRQVADLLTAPSLVSQALQQALQSGSPGTTLRTLRVHARPDAGVIRYSVDGSSRDTAASLAGQLGVVVVQTIDGTIPKGQSVLAADDFELGSGDWGATGVPGHVASIREVHGGLFESRGLRIACGASLGCGASRVLNGTFPAGRPLTLSVWARGRARRPSSVLAALGATATDRAKGPPALVGRAWKRLAVRWTPARRESQAVLTVAATGAGPVDVVIDGALLQKGRDILSPRR